MQIVEYEARHAGAWRTLNEAWIRRWFTLEAKDEEVLSNPQGAILDKGGRIFIAEQENGQVVGCVALQAMSDGGLEVAKMAVEEAARGSGVGRRLMQECVAAARAAGAARLYLESNRKLAPAIGLYRAFGFRELEPTPTPYARCDIQMELPLGEGL
jgi:N-acetylglutamate synthase-like GNAT family acetyltransferase